ncbi:hypothetical protein pb186bvf_004971 [Paramecium bursaria]
MNTDDKQSQLSEMAIKFNLIQQRIYEIQQNFGDSSFQLNESNLPKDRVQLLNQLCEKCKQNIFQDNQSNNVEGSIQQLLDQNYYLLKSYYESQEKLVTLESTLEDKNNEISILREQLNKTQTNLKACKTYIKNSQIN